LDLTIFCSMTKTPLEGELLDWVVLAVVYPVAVGPLVVPGFVDKRALERLVQVESMTNESVVAPLAAGLDVARVHDEVDVIVPIDLGNQSAERRLPFGPVGHVADQGECEGRHTVSPLSLLLGGDPRVRDGKAQRNGAARQDSLHGAP
jgi:hypothetical protein